MKKSPRFLLFFIFLLATFSIIVNLPNFNLGGLEFKKGLDLSGGVSLVFKADTSNIPPSSVKDAMDSAREVLERRVNLFGVSEAIVQTSVSGNENRIIVEIPGVSDVERAKRQIGKTAELSFWEEEATGSGTVATSSAVPTGLTPGYKKTELSGRDLRQATLTFDPNTGAPVVGLSFTAEGKNKFADITERNVGKNVAIVLDNELIELPRVNEAIVSGDAVISGSFTTETAKDLVKQLNAGALPVTLTVISQHVVGPTLGIDSLKKSLFAGILGFILIVGFMIYIYGFSGAIASLALCLYVLFNLAIYKLSSATPAAITLTLAGVAGFILSIGMAVDANILIFERIKEEIRSGKNRTQALEIGFKRAWSSIRDSNVATLITSFILYQFGTGQVRGFALILAIGVLVSMFSAITVTRTLLRVVYKT